MATLYRKYRPQKFADLVGQDHVRRTLQAALAQDRLGHAYLLAGPRGTGKTTVARLLAKAVNCQTRKTEDRKQKTEPCNACQICSEITDGRALDVIEIDAASNRGIDEIRELRDKIRFAPSQAKKKVFIIDEVHMLTKEAFNALLKTLEEPPAHALFVLATTELHKVPTTITSRCQVFVFKKAATDHIVGQLESVAKAEGIKAEPAALGFLARLAGGSYRDALSLLDQVASMSDQPLTLDRVREILGLAQTDLVIDLLKTVGRGDAAKSLSQLSEIEAAGTDLDHLASQLIDAGRLLLHIKFGATLDVPTVSGDGMEGWQVLAKQWSAEELVHLIETLVAARSQMKVAIVPLLPLEVAAVKLANREQRTENRKEQEREPKQAEPVEHNESPKADVVDVSPEIWQQVVLKIRDQNMGLYGLLQQAHFDRLEGNHLHVHLPFQFGVDRLSERKYRQLVEQTVEAVTGQPCILVCQLRQPNKPALPPQEPLDDLSQAITEVFGVEEASQ